MSWTFQSRWRVDVELRSRAPFHIGTGDALDDECERDRESLERRNAPTYRDADGVKRRVKVSSVVTSHRGRPYIPATALKGAMRSWLLARLTEPADRNRIEKVFGSLDTTRADAVGGMAEFLDAIAADACPDLTNVPYADRERWTGITASVAIDRRTRTAAERKLYHEEYVPPGVGFHAMVTAQNLDEDDIALILLALDHFGDGATDPIVLGASGHQGWGRFACADSPVVRCLHPEGLDGWLARRRTVDQLMSAYDELDEVPAAMKERIWRKVAELRSRASRGPILEMKLQLQFDGPFLVNDPSRAKRDDAPDDDELPNHSPRRDHEGKVVLPARSIRGAFRSQAERIVRTLVPHAGGDPNRRDSGCEPVAALSEVKKLSLIAQVFGAPGWRSAVEFSDFIDVSGAEVRPQEFVAIDRFTGGAAHRLKFNAEYVECPLLEGSIRIDLRSIEPWALGLLALTLRDLIEGDITLGFGASKGYGVCRAAITSIPPPAHFGECRQWAEDWELDAIDWHQPLISLLDSDEVQSALEIALSELRSKLGL